MPTGVPRVALWALAVMMLATTLTITPGVQAASPSSYAIHGYVLNGASIPVPAGVTVDLISGATHQTYSTTTGSGGGYSFSNSYVGGALTPGYWGLWVPPEGNVTHGSACKPCAVFPAQNGPTYYYESAKNLSSATSVRSITGVSLLSYNATILGNVTQGASREPGCDVQLIDPAFNNLVLYNNTTGPVGNYSLKAPWGTWVVETTLPGVPTNKTDFTQVVVATSSLPVKVNPSISPYLTYGTVYQASAQTQEVPFGGNVTLYEPSTHYIYSSPTIGGFYLVGTYPAGFSGSGADTFDVVVSSIGYQTEWYPLTVSGANPTGGTNPHNLLAPAEFTPAVYNTTLVYSPGFGWLNTSSHVTLGNDSTIPELANASVGQLWAQLALDWQGNVTFSGANLAAVESWVNSSGPFFPVGAANAKINATGYNETAAGGTFGWSSTCPSNGYCGLSGPNSAASISYSWAKNYQANGTVPTGQKSYTASFNFRHPDNSQTINYTVDLPKGFVLSADNPVPSGATLVPAGPHGTWTNFTLVSQPWSTPSSTATFTFVKYGNVTANVNASVSQFAFSKANVLNSTHGNYSVIVGVGQNVTFSAAGSIFPSNTNGTAYAWTWGDGSNSSSTNAISYHTYSAGAKEYDGSVTVTSSGGTDASVAFHVYVGSGFPTGSIVSNASTAETMKTPGGTTYLMVNWSTTLQFNATGFSSSLFAGGPKGVISVADWNATAGTFNQTTNLTASAGVNVNQNFTVTFNCGTGATPDKQYLSSAVINGSTVKFLGWQYNITLEIWDGIGHEATDRLVVLVKDTEKPTSVATVQNSAGTNVTSAGVVESANHTAEVKLVGSYSSDPNGGGIVWYNWSISNSANTSFSNVSVPIRNATGLRAPAAHAIWLVPQSKAYTLNLTVTDRAGNTAYNVASLTVAINTSTRPVLSVANMTGPSTLSAGTSYTFWVNVTDTLGANSTAEGVQVRFYLLPPSGSGSQVTLGSTPGSTVFYGYTNGTVNASSMGTGTISLKYNQTVRAQFSFTPSRTGTWNLWANATATNEFGGDYVSGENQAHVGVTINANPLTTDLEYAAVAAAVIAVLVIAFLVYRRSQRRGRPGGRGSDRSPSKKEKADKADADDEDDDS